MFRTRLTLSLAISGTLYASTVSGQIDGVMPGSIHGRKWSDENGDGRRDSSEPGVPGVTVYGDHNNNRVLDRGEPSAVTMRDDPATDFNEAGLYRLEVRPGRWIIREVVPDGFEQTFPARGAHAVVVAAGQGVEGVDFGNRPIKSASIHGRKWSDENGDGRRDSSEPGLPGVTIYTDHNNNGVLDRGEPSTLTMRDDPATDFDEAGLYWLEVRPGRHIVREVVPDGFEQTFPPDTIVPPAARDDEFARVRPSMIRLRLEAGDVAVEEVALTILPLCIRPFQVDVVAPGAPAGMVTNLSGVQTNGCGGDVSAFKVQFAGDGASHAFDLQFVDTEGGSVLAEIPVRINLPSADGAHVVVLEPGDVVEGIDFGNRPVRPGSIHGLKWSDENGDGRRDPDEAGLGGVTVYLDLNLSGRHDRGEPSAVTMEEDPFTDFDEGGLYWLEVKAGRYVVREVVPDGFRQTFPDAGAHRVAVGSGETIEGIDFGNRRGSPPNQVPGDCNQNGECDFSDAICLLRALFAHDRRLELPCGDGTIEHPSNVLLLDFDGSGKLDVVDVIAKLLFVFFVDQRDHDLGPRCVFIPDCGATCGQ